MTYSRRKNDRYQTLRIREVVNIAKDSVNLVFDTPTYFEYKPGQFLTIIKKVKGKENQKSLFSMFYSSSRSIPCRNSQESGWWSHVQSLK